MLQSTGWKPHLDKLSLETSCSFPLLKGHWTLEELFGWGEDSLLPGALAQQHKAFLQARLWVSL